MADNKIEIDFSEAKLLSEKVTELAANMKRIANQQFQQTLQELATCWKGDTANAYLRKAEIVREEIEKSAKDLQKIGESIFNRAKALYAAEKAAVRIVETNNQNH